MRNLKDIFFPLGNRKVTPSHGCCESELVLDQLSCCCLVQFAQSAPAVEQGLQQFCGFFHLRIAKHRWMDPSSLSAKFMAASACLRLSSPLSIRQVAFASVQAAKARMLRASSSRVTLR